MWNLANAENVDIEFLYGDADSHANEIAELYSYTEEPEFTLNRNAFEGLMEDNGFPLRWNELTRKEKDRALEIFSDGMELSVKASRMIAVRSVLYLVQGTFGECSTLQEQADFAKANVFELYQKGFFPAIVQLLHLEIESSILAMANVPKKPTHTLSDSTDMRVILSILCTFVELMRISEEEDVEDHLEIREAFAQELSQPIGSSTDLLAITLFQMATKFCNGSAPHFPIRKVLLLLWKVILVSVGGKDTLKSLKSKYRDEVGLAAVPDDTLEVTRTMRAASPPASAAEIMEAQNQRKMNRPFKRQTIVKQTSVGGEESNDQDAEGNSENNDEDAPQADEGISVDGSSDAEVRKNNTPEEKMDMGPRPASPRPSNAGLPPLVEGAGDDPCGEIHAFSKGLPWSPKVRQRDIDGFLDNTRSKFIGFTLPGDRHTTAGLPGPILEGIKILKQHLYISLSEIQTKKEEDLVKYPLTLNEDNALALGSPAETLYQAMLPSLSQYMIALLKILLAAAPTSRARTESINIMSDLLPEVMPVPVINSMDLKLGIDVSRHKEVIIKAVSAILLLLLKHYKINHVYQFEYISQQLMFANCIPLVLKFFNQNICQYVSAKTSITVIDFPACVVGEQPELTMESLEMSQGVPYCWRNLFSCINLLRILNKLTKWKHSRVMMLVVFKSSPILKRALKLRHAMLQLYVLKLLKMQAKYLGRQWRKSNMKTMSAIYQKVRHRITDDWAYGNDLDARPWDFQAEEFALQANINRFHNRRYGKGGQAVAASHPSQHKVLGAPPMNEALLGELDLLQSVDNNFLSVLSADVELTNEFKFNYETWLQREVFQYNVDWDQLLVGTDSSGM